jgi:hypothetical protein
VPRWTSFLPAALTGLAAGLGLSMCAGNLMRVSTPAKSLDVVLDVEVLERVSVHTRDHLPDAGIAVFDARQPRIYLNARLLAQLGPEMAAFLRAHEQGHIAYHHVSERRFGLVRRETPLPVLHQFEFAADCYAAQSLREERPLAVRTALRFFQQRRDVVPDAEHPSMSDRADSLIDCLTDPSRRLTR